MSHVNGHPNSSSAVPISRKRRLSASVDGELPNDRLGTSSKGLNPRKRRRNDIAPSDQQKDSSSSSSAVSVSRKLLYSANIKDLFHKQYPDIPQLPSPTWFSSTRNPPSLYDSLPHIHLTLQALDELSRRNALLPKSAPIALGRDPGVEPDSLPLRREQTSADLQRFARVGGPNLTDLRGYIRPTSIRLAESETLNTESLPMSQQKRKSDTQEDLEGDKKKSKRTNAYDENFMTKLVQRNVNCIAKTPEPNNFHALKEILKKPRPELTEPNFTGKCQDLQDAIDREGLQNEDSVLDSVVPIIMGDRRDTKKFYTARNKLCTIWANLVEDTQLVQAQPDYFDGLKANNDNALLYHYLEKLIVPAKNAPFLPNFFFEVKGPSGVKEIAQRQATYDGSFGARAMHYTRRVAEEDFSDGNAYSFSAIYASEVLRLFAHFIRQKKEPGMLHYHTVALRAFILQDEPDQVREAITSFRNLRDHALDVRNMLEKAAMRKLRPLAKLKPLGSYECPDAKQELHIGDDTPPPEDDLDL